MLTSTPIVQPPDWMLSFEIMCDASDYMIRIVLEQQRDMKPYVVYHASKKINGAQISYAITEKEFLAIVFALDKSCLYNLG